VRDRALTQMLPWVGRLAELKEDPLVDAPEPFAKIHRMERIPELLAQHPSS